MAAGTMHRADRTGLIETEQGVCPLEDCMNLLGGAWTPNVIWALRPGPRRFSELMRDLPSVSAKVLTTRLRQLERDGVVTRRVEATSPPSVSYEITELGAELFPVIDAIVDVSKRLRSARAARVRSVSVRRAESGS